MSLKQKRIALHLTLTLNLATAFLTQLFVQFGGGGRNDSISIEGSMGISFLPTEFASGLPPFISSGAVFPPEGTIFQFSVALTGALLTFVSVFLTNKTFSQLKMKKIERPPIRRFFIGALAGNFLIGVAIFPMHTDILVHSIFAYLMFGSMWLFSMLMSSARAPLDLGVHWFGLETTKARRMMLTISGLAMAISGIGFLIGEYTLSAIFEWVLFLNLNCLLHTFGVAFRQNAGD